MEFFSDAASKFIAKTMARISRDRRDYEAPEIETDLQYLNFEKHQQVVYNRLFKGVDEEAMENYTQRVLEEIEAQWDTPQRGIITKYIPVVEFELKATREVVEILETKEKQKKGFFQQEMKRRREEYVRKKAERIFERKIGVWNRKRLKNVKKIGILEEKRSEERKELAQLIAKAIAKRVGEFYMDENIKLVWETNCEGIESWFLQF